jgi:ABC-type lipoprotein release transport system permease subunit
MKILIIKDFVGKIARKNIFRSLLIIFSIFTGSLIMFLFLSLAQGVKNTVLTPLLASSNPDTLVVTSQPGSAVFSLLNVNKAPQITEEAISTIENYPETASVDRLLLFKFLSTVNIDIINFRTDSPIFGIEKSLEESAEFQNASLSDEVIPVAISPFLINIFNTTFAASIDGIPAISEELILNREIEIQFGQSSFGHLGLDQVVTKHAKIVVISEKVPSLGIAIPLNVAQEFLLQVNPDLDLEDINYSQLYVEAQDLESLPQLEAKIEASGLTARNFEELGEKIVSILNIFQSILLITSLLFILIAIFSLFSLISITVIEQRQNIGILKSLGAKNSSIVLIFGLLALLLSAIGVTLGLALAPLLANYFNSYLASSNLLLEIAPASFFDFSLPQAIMIFIGINLVAILSALPPIVNCLRQEPMKSILD